MYSSERSFFNHAQEFDKDVDYIAVVNELFDKLATKGKNISVPLPQIAVVGSEGTGKTSVIISVIGRDFLPRGPGCVTRRPTIIQLISSKEEYVVFLHRPDQKFTDYDKVKQEIINETLKDPGETGFSSNPISMKIFLPNVLNLTLVDLPGCFKIPIGDHRVSNIDEVNQMILSHIKEPHTIILAISPANSNLSTSDSLPLAQKVDPNFERTIGVLTKLDIMEAGTNAFDILSNSSKVFPLARGYVGVVNRDQDDINAGRTIEEGRLLENRFFENHPAYSKIAHLHGSQYLHKKLHILLQEHIRKCLPTVRKEITQKLSILRKDLKEFECLMSDKSGCDAVQSYVLSLVQKLNDELHTELFGCSEYIPRHRMIVGAIINFDVHSELEKILDMPIQLDEAEMARIIANGSGIRNILSVPSSSLEAAISKLIWEFKNPLDSFVASVAELLIAAVGKFSESVRRYHSLRNELVKLIGVFIDQSTEETKELIGKILNAQAGCVNVYHPDFDFLQVTKLKCKHCQNTFANAVKGEGNSSTEDDSRCLKGLPNAPVKIWGGNVGLPENKSDLDAYSEHISIALTQNEAAQCNAHFLSSIVLENMKLVKKQIVDIALKCVVTYLIKAVSEFVKGKLVNSLLTSEKFPAILEECGRDFQYRDSLQETCNDFESALNAVRTF